MKLTFYITKKRNLKKEKEKKRMSYFENNLKRRDMTSSRCTQAYSMLSCTLHLVVPCHVDLCVHVRASCSFFHDTPTKGETSETNDFNGTSCITSVSHAPRGFRDEARYIASSNIVLKRSLVRSVNAVHCGALLFIGCLEIHSFRSFNYSILRCA